MEKNIQPSPTNGKICYIEIPAIDINNSATFYETVFGWEIRKRGDGNLAFNDSTGQVSGTWKAGGKIATDVSLLVYIMVDDVAATANTIIAHGGKIVQPLGMDAPEITARFSDP